jgi:hypothetical protein
MTTASSLHLTSSLAASQPPVTSKRDGPLRRWFHWPTVARIGGRVTARGRAAAPAGDREHEFAGPARKSLRSLMRRRSFIAGFGGCFDYNAGTAALLTIGRRRRLQESSSANSEDEQLPRFESTSYSTASVSKHADYADLDHGVEVPVGGDRYQGRLGESQMRNTP